MQTQTLNGKHTQAASNFRVQLTMECLIISPNKKMKAKAFLLKSVVRAVCFSPFSRKLFHNL